jgi:hypothetical protein
MLLLLFGNCGGCGDGCASVEDGITDHENAPFSLSDARVLFTPDANNDGGSAVGVLMVTTGSLSCDELATAVGDGSLVDAVDESALVFTLQQYAGDPDASPLNGFSGLWMGYGYANGAERNLYAEFIHDSTVHTLSQPYETGGNTWLDIETSSNTGLTGSFASDFWSGRFTAIRCDSYSYGDGGDTGWDSGF